MLRNLIVFFVLFFFIGQSINAQKRNINWISFEQLEDSLEINPKKTLIFFFTNNCVYCKKMEQAAFKDGSIISLLNRDFYKIKFNANSTDTISFGNKTYVNREVGKMRSPKHEIALLLASRKNKPFSTPSTLLLDKDFLVTKRFFEYLSPERLLSILE